MRYTLSSTSGDIHSVSFGFSDTSSLQHGLASLLIVFFLPQIFLLTKLQVLTLMVMVLLVLMALFLK